MRGAAVGRKRRRRPPAQGHFSNGGRGLLLLFLPTAAHLIPPPSLLSTAPPPPHTLRSTCPRPPSHRHPQCLWLRPENMVFVAAEEGEGDFRCYKEGGKRPQFRGGKEREGDGQGKMLAGILMRACGRHIDRRLAAAYTHTRRSLRPYATSLLALIYTIPEGEGRS